MTSNKQERIAQHKRARKAWLAEHGITLAEAALFCRLHYGGNFPPDELPRHAAREVYSGGEATVAQCRDALAGCLAKGWLQIVDEAALQAITRELEEFGFIGPIYGLPEVGSVDFTRESAKFWERLGEPLLKPKHPGFAFGGVVHQKTARFFPKEAKALEAIEELRTYDDVVGVTGPFEIGPWRVQWWRRYSQGFRIEVEERFPEAGRGAKERYRKERRFAETEEGVGKTLQGYTDSGETMLRVETVPIGPWCVRWWDRYPSGFRFDVEIGKP